MRPLILKCPSCEGNLTVTRLSCPDCSITIDGSFGLPALLRLTPAQIDFVEVFVKNRGVIREVERELGVSYPTVRARLDEAIRALGFQVQGEARDESESRGDHNSDDDPTESALAARRAVLAELKAGKITPEQALAALGSQRKPAA
jgi:hypothetical protein